jgi:hypothetical protein
MMIEFIPLPKVDNETLRYYIDAAFNWCSGRKPFNNGAEAPKGSRRALITPQKLRFLEKKKI